MDWSTEELGWRHEFDALLDGVSDAFSNDEEEDRLLNTPDKGTVSHDLKKE